MYVELVVSWFQFYTWRTWGSERLSTYSKFCGLWEGENRFELRRVHAVCANGFQIVVPGLAASASPENLLDMQILLFLT